MKKLLLICLMAGYGHCFAQNLDLKDLQLVLDARNYEIVNPLLAPKGYSFFAKKNALQWSFKSDVSGDAADLTRVLLVLDSLKNTSVVYETSNPFFYTNLLNQLSGNNYQYKLTTATDTQINMIFSNSKYELLLDPVRDGKAAVYRISLQPVNSSASKLPPAYDHRIRVNSY